MFHGQPNRFAGNHGARFNVKNPEEINVIVLEKYPKGTSIKLNCRNELVKYNKDFYYHYRGQN